MRLLKVSALILLLAQVVGCANSAAGDSAELSRQAAAEALRIKTVLLSEPDLAGAAIDVNFDAGRVTLEGFVETAGQRARAVELARRQEGVDTVVDAIVVK